MNQTSKKILLSIAKILTFIIAIILIWLLLAYITDNELILPSPIEVIKLTFKYLLKKETYLSLFLTISRALIAFVSSIIFAFLLIIIVGVFEKTKPYIDFIVTILRTIPTIAIILLAMLAFKSSFIPIIVTFLVAFPVTYSAFQRELYADINLFNICKVYNVTTIKKIKYFIFPQVKQSLFYQCKDTLPLCIKIIIAGEVLALPKTGLGKDMYVAKVNLLTANVLALTLLSLTICLIISGIFTLCQRRSK